MLPSEEHFHARLAAFIAEIAPLIARPAPKPAPAERADHKIVKAAIAVSEAVSRLDQMRFAQVNEIAARKSLERKARALRTVLERRKGGRA